MAPFQNGNLEVEDPHTNEIFYQKHESHEYNSQNQFGQGDGDGENRTHTRSSQDSDDEFVPEGFFLGFWVFLGFFLLIYRI